MLLRLPSLLPLWFNLLIMCASTLAFGNYPFNVPYTGYVSAQRDGSDLIYYLTPTEFDDGGREHNSGPQIRLIRREEDTGPPFWLFRNKNVTLFGELRNSSREIVVSQMTIRPGRLWKMGDLWFVAQGQHHSNVDHSFDTFHLTAYLPDYPTDLRTFYLEGAQENGGLAKTAKLRLVSTLLTGSFRILLCISHGDLRSFVFLPRS